MAYIELNEQNFNDTVTNNDIVIIDFWAPWCGPCKSFGPVFEQVAEANTDITFAKVNTEEQQGLAGHFQIRSIPTLMILKEQIVVFNQAGALSQEGLNDLIRQVKELDMDRVRAEIAKEQEKQA
ncbi:MAG: thioredoxin [Campylobacterales bacterium]|nr:thioredoxin [Campylobacterales bacterium]